MFSYEIGDVLRPGISGARDSLAQLVNDVNGKPTMTEAETFKLKMVFTDYMMRYELQAKLHQVHYETSKTLVQQI